MKLSPTVPQKSLAFSLLEVMIAVGIFFVSIFAILRLTTQNLRAARILQNLNVDTGTLPSLIVMTNRLEEGPLPLDIKEAFESAHPGFSCDGVVTAYTTNGLFQVDYAIYWQHDGRAKEARNSMLLWRPLSHSRTQRLRR